YQDRIDVELLWMTDETGKLLSGSPGGPRVGESIAELSPLREVIQGAETSSAIEEVNGALFQLVAVPLFGPDVIGFLVVGEVIDDALATRLRRDTGSDISFLTSSRVFASSWPRQRLDQLVREVRLREVLSGQPAPRNLSLVSVSGERFLSLVV